MVAITEKMKAAAVAGAEDLYYEAVYEYSAVGLSSADNPILTQIIVDLLPAVRRIHFIALVHHTQDLKENFLYFEHLTERMLEYDPDGGETVMREYIADQKNIALQAVRECK